MYFIKYIFIIYLSNKIFYITIIYLLMNISTHEYEKSIKIIN